MEKCLLVKKQKCLLSATQSGFLSPALIYCTFFFSLSTNPTKYQNQHVSQYSATSPPCLRNSGPSLFIPSDLWKHKSLETGHKHATVEKLWLLLKQMVTVVFRKLVGVNFEGLSKSVIKLNMHFICYKNSKLNVASAAVMHPCAFALGGFAPFTDHSLWHVEGAETSWNTDSSDHRTSNSTNSSRFEGYTNVGL